MYATYNALAVTIEVSHTPPAHTHTSPPSLHALRRACAVLVPSLLGCLFAPPVHRSCLFVCVAKFLWMCLHNNRRNKRTNKTTKRSAIDPTSKELYNITACGAVHMHR